MSSAAALPLRVFPDATSALSVWHRQRRTAVSDISALVGNTPLVRLRHVTRDLSPKVEVYAKLEFLNPGGSVKDRPALQIIKDAEASGRLGAGKALIDATSGNTGVAYAMLGAARGHEICLVMPSNVSQARKDITRAFGATLIFSDPMDQSDGAIRLVRDLVERDTEGRYFYADQYSNEANPRAHYLTTGREIFEATEGRVTHFVTGIGTSGTIMGTGRRLKAYRPDIQVIAVEPDDAFHALEGLKHMASSIVPNIFKAQELDGTISMPSEEGWDMADRLGREEGLLVGHSGGANVAGALRVARQLEQGVVVTVLCDHADRYLDPPKLSGRIQ
jgi:cysteine synthase B